MLPVGLSVLIARARQRAPAGECKQMREPRDDHAYVHSIFPPANKMEAFFRGQCEAELKTGFTSMMQAYRAYGLELLSLPFQWDKGRGQVVE